MGRCGSGGGRSSFRAPRAKTPPPAPAPCKAAPAPAASGGGGGGGSIVGSLGSAIVDGWGWGAGMAMAHRAMDYVLGLRTFRIEHSHQATASASPAAAAASSSCDVHAQAFQDCINHNGSDISKCQFYIDILNDCRRRGQAAIVETHV